MKAKELAEILLKNPDYEVVIVKESVDSEPTGWGAPVRHEYYETPEIKYVRKEKIYIS